MDEFLNWLHSTVLPDVPSLTVVSDTPMICGYIGDRRVDVHLTESGLVEISRARELLDDLQEVRLSPEMIGPLCGHEERSEGGRAVTVCGMPGDRIAYIGRTGPEVQTGSVSREGFPLLMGGFESYVAFAPEGVFTPS